jgi:hypothetical protein
VIPQLIIIGNALMTTILLAIAAVGLQHAWNEGHLGKVLLIAGVGLMVQRLCTMPKR